ncbi:MAG: DUF1573 domain-containing protein [Nitrospinae bacterium]|nr:DUF1573 domain-containing protein [Nitrospinota bacterium]
MALLVIASAAHADDRLSFPVTKWDFGKTASSGKKRHVFKFRNKGKESLNITKLTPSCGCAAAVAGSSEIAPGGDGSIKVEFDPAGLEGRHESTVLVAADDGSEVTLTVSADVEPARPATVLVTPLKPVLKVTPTVVNLGKMKEGEAVQYKVVVENAGYGDLFLTNLTDANEAGVPLNSKPIGNGKKVEITFFYTPLGKGKIKDSVLIRSNDPRRPEVRIKLKGVVR